MVMEFDSEGRFITRKLLKNEEDFEKNKSISVSIRGKEDYIFDNDDYELFKRKFKYQDKYYISETGYLLIKIEPFKVAYHRFLISEKISEFCEKNNCELSEVEVHHINFNHKDNRRENLKVMFVGDHEFLHKEDRTWNEYRKKMSEFWRKNKGEDYYREIFNYKLKLGLIQRREY